MIGAPGVGKGTYSRMLSKDMKISELSSGDELRKIVKNNLDGNISKTKDIMDKGKLVDDEYIFGIVKNKLKEEAYANGAILDGFPRTISQAKEFENFKHIDLVVKIDLNEDVLVRKLLGRRMCVHCGTGYNVCSIFEGDYDMEALLPKNNIDKCDNCGDRLIQRDDDTDVIIRKRIKLYKDLTKPVEEYYNDKNLVKLFEPKKGLKDYPVLRELVSEYLTNNRKLI
jgi:adenylate kinase